MMMDELLDLDNPNLTHFTTQRRSFPFLSCTMRQALTAGEESAFKEAIAQCVKEDPEDILSSAWAYRLDIQSAEAEVEVQVSKQDENRHWWTAVVGSVTLGILYALFAGDKPPVPVPGEANPLFWIGWAPLTALGVLFYLAIVDRANERIRWYGGAAIVVIFVGVVTAFIAWDRTDHTTILIALHLPFIVWAVVGGSVVLGCADAARQFYAYLVKSVETILTAGVYLVAGIIFGGLTFGIFAVLGIQLSEDHAQTVAAWGIGAIPVLALASVYQPASTPIQQNWETGLARILRILTRLMLPLALGVLAVYVCWFIPVYFERPFEEREVLIVYNATIMAIIALLASTVTESDEQRTPKQDLVLRYAVLAMGVLTILLNVYALAAIVSRTVEFGLTPNRHAVLGWNIVTLLMLAVIVTRLWQAKSEVWIYVFRESMARVMVPAIGWAVWVLWGLPHF